MKVIAEEIAGVVVEPLDVAVIAPIELSIEKVTAFVVVQERVVELPESIFVGLAERVHVGVVGGGGGGVVVIVIVAVQVAVPLGLVTVPV